MRRGFRRRCGPAARRPSRARPRSFAIGEITEAAGLKLRLADGQLRPISPRGFDHFRAGMMRDVRMTIRSRPSFPDLAKRCMWSE